MTLPMTRARNLPSILVAAIVLVGCDTVPNIRLYNGLARPIDLAVAKGSREPQKSHLAPGEAVQIKNIYGPGLRLAFDGCEWRYLLPYMDLNHPWRIPDGQGGSAPDYQHLYPVDIQLQADSFLYLRPYRAKGVVPIGELESAQAHGYPLKPVSKICAEPTSPS